MLDIQRVLMAGLPTNGKSCPQYWWRGLSTQSAQHSTAVTAPPRVGCIVSSRIMHINPFDETTIDTGNTLIDKMKDEKKKS